LSWRQSASRELKPLDALKIYALKTAPAFEVALYAGLRLAGPADAYAELVSNFSRHLGVAFQILNDLNDWDGDDNKLLEGQDVLAARPTLLLALALEAADDTQRRMLLDISNRPTRTAEELAAVRAIYRETAVFEKAELLVEKYRERAEAVADDAEPTELRELLYFLVDTVLDRRPAEASEVITPTLHQVSSP
jgi:geranylgeranyl pyrophosphate synthase